MSALFENGFTPIHAMLLASVFFAVVVVELGYMVFSPNRDGKKHINRRMNADNLKNRLSQKQILIQLRKERGLDEHGNLMMPFFKRLNRLIVQSGVTLGMARLSLYYFIYLFGTLAAITIYWKSAQVTLIAL